MKCDAQYFSEKNFNVHLKTTRKLRPNFVFFDACILFRKNNIYFIISFINFVTIIIKKHNIPVIKLILAIQSKLLPTYES